MMSENEMQNYEKYQFFLENELSLERLQRLPLHDVKLLLAIIEWLEDKHD